MPTKVLTHTAEVLETSRHAAQVGVEVGEPALNLEKLRQRQGQVVKQLTGGVGMLLKSQGVQVLPGEAAFTGPRQVTVRLSQGGEAKVEADAVIIATGSVPLELPVPGLELEGVWDSDRALGVPEIPERLLVVGGGVIGCEFADIYQSFGSQVTIIEMLPRILPPVDAEIAGLLDKEFRSRGMEIHTGTRLLEVQAAEGVFQVRMDAGGQEQTLEGDRVLMAVGRRPFSEGLNLEAAGVKSEKGRILVDEHLETSQPGVYAVGDCIGNWMLAHVAFAEGERAAENALGDQEPMVYRAVPNCIFTRPEVASTGWSEEEAREEAGELQVGRFPFQANGKALIEQQPRGLVKLVAGAEYGEVLGLHIIGHRASDLILEGSLALTMEATLEEIYGTVHPHPTLGEALAEAALDAEGRALHLPRR